MFSHYFENLSNVEIYAVFSLVLFLIIFMVMIVWVIRLDKKYINKMGNIPLEKSTYEDYKK
jgi:TM2 domain-containing membrane protein YozV